MPAPRPHKRQCLNPTEPHPLLAMPGDVWELVCALVADNPRWLFATWSFVCSQAPTTARPVRFATLRLDADGIAVPAARWQEWREITQLTITGESTGRVLRAVRAGQTRVQTLLLGTVNARNLGDAVYIRALRALGCDRQDQFRESDSEPTLVPYADWLDVGNHEVDDDALALYLRTRKPPLRTLIWERRQVNYGLCEALRSSTELRQLKMQFCSFPTFDWLAALPELRSLDLTQCPQVTDVVLETLSVLRKLEQLSLQRCDNVTLVGLASLSGLCHLRYLDLGYVSQLTNLSFLVNLPGLSKLHVNNCNLGNAALATLGSCRQLQVLDLSGNEGLTDAGLGPLSTLDRLTTLHLNFCPGIYGSGLTCLADLPELRSLSLQGCLSLTNLGARPLPPKLQNLSLIFCESLRDGALLQIARLAQLRELDLTGCRLLTSAGLQHLAALHSLQKLNLFFCSSLRDVRSLAELKALTQLSLQGCKVTASQLVHLPPNLQRLDLSYNPSLTDAAFAYLAGLTRLQTLRLIQCPAITRQAVLDFQAQRPLLSVVIDETDTPERKRASTNLLL